MSRRISDFTSIMLCLCLALYCLPCRAKGIGSDSSAGLVEIYRPFLTDLPDNPAKFNPFLGGQDFDVCCRLAVNESLVIENDTLMIRPGQTFYRSDIAMLERFPQFPCFAKFNGTMAGPPQDFWTPYSWCRRRCPGWAATKPEALGSWLKPLSAFILPSLIFCLSIPRRRRIEIPKRLFSEPSSFLGTLFIAPKILAAATIASVEILIWLSVVFAVSGPILVSAVYEAVLDARILEFLHKRIGSNSLSVRSRAHLLLAVLLGNLDLDPAWHHSQLFVKPLPMDPFLARLGVSTPVAGDSTPAGVPPPSDTGLAGPTPPILPSTRKELWADQTLSTEIQSVQSRLQAMLDSQYSFGSTVGAPVLFYVAAFSWSVYEIESTYGSYSSAHQLAFGLVWMTIPHIALVTSLLLAGSNPNVFQGSVPQDGSFNNTGTAHASTNGSTPFARQQMRSATPPPLVTAATGKLYFKLLRGVSMPYKSMHRHSSYKSAWVWNRGANKAMWIARLAGEYPTHLASVHKEVLQHRFGSNMWMSGLSAFILIFIPVFFGGLVSYNTPQVGLSCRSLTMLSYGLIQAVLIILYLVDMCVWQRGDDGKVVYDNGAVRKSGSVAGYIWYASFALSVCIGVFTSLGGTIFLIIGLYNNCLCYIQARYWLVAMTDPGALVFWNGATDSQLYYSQKWWFPAGIAAAVFMIAVAYMGWWYQQRLRARFHDLASRIAVFDERHLRESTGLDFERPRTSPSHVS